MGHNIAVQKIIIGHISLYNNVLAPFFFCCGSPVKSHVTKISELESFEYGSFSNKVKNKVTNKGGILVDT